MLAGWPTPAHRDYRFANLLPFSERGGGAKGEQLNNAVVHQLTGWGTPTVQDSRHGSYSQAQKERNPNVLSNQVYLTASVSGPARLTSTGELLTGSSAAMANGGQLNPAHSRWLQALPLTWDECALTAHRALKMSKAKSKPRLKHE